MPFISLEHAVRLKKESQKYENPSEHIDEIYDRMKEYEEEDYERRIDMMEKENH